MNNTFSCLDYLRGIFLLPTYVNCQQILKAPNRKQHDQSSFVFWLYFKVLVFIFKFSDMENKVRIEITEQTKQAIATAIQTT